jgi:hypothetical protein
MRVGCCAHRLELLLEVSIQRATLERNNLGRSVRVVGDGRATLGAK